jgi:DNA-binding NarL/FixJ family response regulator
VGQAAMIPIRVIIADDHELFRDGLRRVIEARGLEVVAEAGTGLEAIEQAGAHPGAVMLLDIGMPGRVNGLEAARRMAERELDVRIIMVSARLDHDAVFTAISVGAKGYLSKNASSDQLLTAVELVARGGTAFGGSVADQLASGLLGLDYSPGEHARREHSLSERELQILELLASPRSPSEIARHLGLSQKTVHNHISSIYAKLDVRSRPQAVAKGLELHLISGISG